ncbi:MAG: hypothetical protein RSG92_27605 [Pseudomonas sp.]
MPEEKQPVEEIWSLSGDNGSWDYPSLGELIRNNYGHDCDSAGPISDGGTLVVGSTVHRGIVCKDDPAKFLPDADDVANHMWDAAACSDAGEWVDDYPELNGESEAALKQALEPLKAWARQYCQPKFFTVKSMTTHELTEEDVRHAMSTEAQQ